MLGEKITVYWCDTGDEMAEVYLNRFGIPVPRAHIPEVAYAIHCLTELIVDELALPKTYGKYGYDYQPGPPGYLDRAAEIISEYSVFERPLHALVTKIDWCPFIPRRGMVGQACDNDPLTAPAGVGGGRS